MTTLQEKIAKTRADGWEAARHEIHAKIGEAEVYAYTPPRSSLYAMDLCDRGRRLLVEVDQVEAMVLEFLKLSATGPSAEERTRQRQLDLDDANAAAIAREKAATKATDAEDRLAPDPEIEAVEAELAVELDRVLGAGEGVAAHTERSLGVLMIVVGAQGSYSEGELPEWEVCREAPRVLGALRQLDDGAGPEAVRAILCGLEVAGATEGDGDAQADAALEAWVGEPGEDPDDQVEADIVQTEVAIGAELTRCGADGVEAQCAPAENDGPMEVDLAGFGWGYNGKAAYALDALKLLPDGCGETVVRARLLHDEEPPPPTDEDLPGRPVGEPAKRRKPKAKKAELSGPPDYYDGKRTGD